VLVHTQGRLSDEMMRGAQVTMDGVLHLPLQAQLPGLFDYRDYLRRQGVYYQFTVDDIGDWTLNSPSRGLSRKLHQMVAWCRENQARGLPEQDLSLRLIGAMTLGLRSSLTGEVKDPFIKSGTMHVFAISGLHVGMIGSACVGLLVLLRLPRKGCSLLVIPFLWIYAAATGWQPSAVRAVIMFSVILAGWTLQRPPDLVNSMAGAAVLLLIWDPQQLFRAGFQLSFVVVFSLLLVTPTLGAWLQGNLQPDPYLPRELVTRFRRKVWQMGRYAGAALGGSLVAWMASLPLVAANFHYVTPVGVLANLVMLPLSGFTVISSLGSSLTGFWFPGCAVLFNHSAWFWMRLMIETSRWASSLPGAWIHVETPPLSLTILYYGLLFGILTGVCRAPRFRLSWGLGLAVVAVWSCFQARVSWYRECLTMVPLKGGQMIFHQQKGGKNNLLIDGGDTKSVESVTLPWLKSLGVKRLPHWLLTHGDVRHVGGAPVVDAAIPAGRLYAGYPPSRSRPYRDALNGFESTGRLRFLETGHSIEAWQVLHPSRENAWAKADDNAVVLLGVMDGLRVGLLSDLGAQGQEELLERYPDLQVDLLVTGLPSHTEPVSRAMLRHLNPRVLVIMDAVYPFSARATPKLEKRLSAMTLQVFYTRHTGAIMLEKQGGAWQMKGQSSGQVLYRFERDSPMPRKQSQPDRM
jgi:ComEC/Rec2-related protein